MTKLVDKLVRDITSGGDTDPLFIEDLNAYSCKLIESAKRELLAEIVTKTVTMSAYEALFTTVTEYVPNARHDMATVLTRKLRDV